jgi:hypothetical protein
MSYEKLGGDIAKKAKHSCTINQIPSIVSVMHTHSHFKSCLHGNSPFPSTYHSPQRREERRVKDLFICREMPANTNLAAFGKGDDHFFTPKGMSGFVQSVPADWTENQFSVFSVPPW